MYTQSTLRFTFKLNSAIFNAVIYKLSQEWPADISLIKKSPAPAIFESQLRVGHYVAHNQLLVHY